MIERRWIGPSLPTSLQSVDTMRQMGRLMADRIRERTQRGQDAQGGSFEPLSIGYAKWKQKAGASFAPLTLSGAMLVGMGVVEVAPAAVVLGFSGGSQGLVASGRTFSQRGRSVSNNAKAFYHCVEGAGKSRVIRDFFDLNESDIEACVAMVDTMIANRLAG